MLKNHELQKYYICMCIVIITLFNLLYLMFRELKANVNLLSSTMLKERFPWLNVDDIELGSLGSLNSGW